MARMLIGLGFGLLSPFWVFATDTFHVSASNKAAVPFDRIEMEIDDLENPLRPIEVKLWKENQKLKIHGSFRIVSRDGSTETLLLSHRNKSEEILLFINPHQKKMLRAVYRKNETIAEFLRGSWQYLLRIMMPNQAVASTAQH